MVLGASGKGTPVKKKGFLIFSLVILGVFVAVATVAVGLIANSFTNGTTVEDIEVDVNQEELKIEEPQIQAVDFQPIVDEWVESVGGNKSVLIYDLDRGELAGSYNSNEPYNTASLYKLLVVYEAYREIQSGALDPDKNIDTVGYTILECLDLAIRESYSPCAETLWDMIGRQNLNDIIKNDFDITNSDISSLTSNPEDVLKIMQLFFKHPEIKDKQLVEQIKDSFLNQPITTYDWRMGLPSGFAKANVYNKVGWDFNADMNYWNLYHDAAIVEFPEQNRHFVVVVMTNLVSPVQVAKLGTLIEDAFINQWSGV